MGYVKISLLSRFAKLVFGDEKYDSWEECGVYFGKLSEVLCYKKAIPVIVFNKLPDNKSAVEVYSEICLIDTEVRDQVRSGNQSSIDSLFIQMVLELDDVEYRKMLGLKIEKDVVIIGQPDILIQNGLGCISVTMRAQVTTLQMSVDLATLGTCSSSVEMRFCAEESQPVQSSNEHFSKNTTIRRLIRQYVLYKNPEEHPGKFVVRGFGVYLSEKRVVFDVTPVSIGCTAVYAIETAERMFEMLGRKLKFSKIDYADDPCVVGVWT